MVDPSLIIYAPVRVLGDYTIVTNGDQTDTVYDLMQAGKTFEESLRTREFEPDAPNYTPRISGLIDQSNNGFSYALSILKSADGDPTSCQRYTFAYSNPIAGVGHFIHTYEGDGNPLPSFSGEPQKIAVSGDIDAFTEMLWSSLNAENKVSLFVRHPGDVMCPLGMHGQSKKLSDLMGEAHVPVAERAAQPVVHTSPTGSVVWVAGLRADERMRCTPATRQLLELRILPV